MVNNQRLEKFEDIQTCRLFNFNVEVESKETEQAIDSGIISRIEEPNHIVMNGKVYCIDDYLFFYRPFQEKGPGL